MTESRDILCDIDTILDTRMTTLWSINEEVMKANSKDWLARHRDDWEGVSGDAFLAVYKERDKALLTTAPLTNMLPYLTEVIRQAIGKADMLSGGISRTFYVNVYPYDLSVEEKDAIRDVVYIKLCKQIEVKVVSFSDKHLTPRRLKSFSFWVKYDWWTWFSAHEALGTFKNGLELCPEVTMLCPEVATKAEEALPPGTRVTPYEALKQLLSIVIDLNFQAVALFSVYDKKVSNYPPTPFGMDGKRKTD